MTKEAHAPNLARSQNLVLLPERNSPYWNILEYCRHVGIEKRANRTRHWLARVRCSNGGYKQSRLGQVAQFHDGGLNYEQAVEAARQWFSLPAVQAVASDPYPVGEQQEICYRRSGKDYTIGDALASFVEWKRIAAARTYFHSSLSLINHHIVPRLADVPVNEFDGRVFTKFCLDVLESPPKRGRQPANLQRTPLQSLDHEALRKRKKTLNAVIGILRLSLEMAWENGEVTSERTWRCVRRIPHADTPRQFFLTRKQAKLLVSACRPDLAKLVLGALYSGCRVSELARLKSRDVGGHFFGIYVAPMKSYKARYVVLPDEGMTFFLDLVEGNEDEDHVFKMASGRSWTGCHKHLFKEAVDRAGLPIEFVFHGLRHTYASQLVQAGTPLAIVARQLGHSNTDTVSRTYGQLSCDSIEVELQKRFAPLKRARKDTRLAKLRDSLQNTREPTWSWPSRNSCRSQGELVSMLRTIEEAGREGLL